MEYLEKLQSELRLEWYCKRTVKYVMWIMTILCFCPQLPIQYPLGAAVASFILLWKCKFFMGSLCLEIEAIKENPLSANPLR